MSEIKNDLKIGETNSGIPLLIKIGLLMLFIFGLLMRIFIPIETFVHLADVMMAVAVLGRLFIHVKALNPSLFLPKQNSSSPLRLIDKKETVVPTYDQRTLTPLERVILNE